jgi:hypothetical protein
MMQKSTAFTTIFRVKKCHFHYEMQKLNYGDLCAEILNSFQNFPKIFENSTYVFQQEQNENAKILLLEKILDLNFYFFKLRFQGQNLPTFR